MYQDGGKKQTPFSRWRNSDVNPFACCKAPLFSDYSRAMVGPTESVVAADALETGQGLPGCHYPHREGRPSMVKIDSLSLSSSPAACVTSALFTDWLTRSPAFQEVEPPYAY